MENNKLTIEILNEVDVNEISPNLEYDIVIIGEQGKSVIQKYLSLK
jgi:hypothetical protein